MAESKLTNQNRKEMLDEYIVQHNFERLMTEYISPDHCRQEIITKAYNFAKTAHSGVYRHSGEPYILHPLAVARIAAGEMGLGSISVCSALLHDVVEDTDFEVPDIRDMFGEKIAQIVDGLTKIPGEKFANQDYKQAENFRKLLLTMSSDIRVVLIKIADRLHNMRTLDAMRTDKKYKISGETMYIYAPLAHRLGLYSIKSELEDLCFKYEHPEEYRVIIDKLKITDERCRQLFDNFAKPVRQRLSQLSMNYIMKARVKSPYSIWKKMQKKHVPFEEVYDIFAVRIVFEPTGAISEKNLCWEVYSAITDIFRSRPDRLHEWISAPKANGYQSLHLTVMGPDGQWIEIQIRSKRMDDFAERGLAAHWRYKADDPDADGDESVAIKEETENDAKLNECLNIITEILANPSSDTLKFLDSIELDLFSMWIFVFTPKGELKTLPQGATALDFAYMLHTNLGNHCIGAKINHRLMPLSHKLESGDQVEILTASVKSPEPEWLNFAKTTRARTKIEAELKRIKREKTRLGLIKVLEYFQQQKKEASQSYINRLMWYFKKTKPEDLYYAVETGEIELPTSLVKELERQVPFSPPETLPQTAAETKKAPKQKFDKTKPYELTEDVLGNCNFRIADCCKPIPGDDVFGYIDQDNTIVVHKQTCIKGLKLRGQFGGRILSTVWKINENRSFEATLKVTGFDKVGVLTDIARTISEFNVNIIRLLVEVKDGVFDCEIKLLVHDVDAIHHLSDAIKALNNIDSVFRIDD